jgi:hypothetical protein
MSLLPKNLRFVVRIVIALVSISLRLQGQAVPVACAKPLQDFKDASAPNRPVALQNLIRPGRNWKCYATIVAGTSPFKAVLKSFEANRTDKQAGSSTGSGGTTNLVSKGVTAQILSFAAEHGALTESVNKNVVTVQGSLDGFPAAFIQKGLVPYCPESEPNAPGCLHQNAIELLRRFSYGISYDTGQGQQNVTAAASGTPQGTAQPVTFTANQQQITQVMGKVMFFQSKESTSSKRFKKEWSDKVKDLKDTAQVGTMLDKLWGDLIISASNKSYENWLQCATQQVGDASNDALAAVWLAHAQRFAKMLKGDVIVTSACAEVGTKDPSIKTDHNLSDLAAHSLSNPEIEQAASNALRALTAFTFNEQQFVTSLIEKPVLTFEYDYNRPIGQPDNSTFKLIYGQGFGDNWSVTWNGSFNIFNSEPKVPGAGRLAYEQTAFEVDRTFTLFGPQTLSGAYYFQHQNSPGILNVTPGNPVPGVTFVGLPANATQVFAQKGNINIAQLKLSVGAGGSNVKFPLSVSYSNRTELITNPTWRAQIGVSYDLDALFAGK